MRWHTHFQNCLFTPIFNFNPEILLLFLHPRTSNVFSLWETWFSSCYSNLLVFSTCFLFTHFLCSSKCYPSFKVWFEFLRTFSASIDLYPQRALCGNVLFRFSYFAFLFLCCSSSFPFYPPTFDLRSKYPYDIYRRSNIWIVLCLVFPLEISRAVMFPWYFHWH